MADYSGFNQGAESSPITQSTTNSLLADVDPVLFAAINFYAAVLKTHLEPRLLAQANACNAPISAAVNTTISIDPGKNPIDTRWRFPLLAVYRQKEKHGLKTTTWRHTDATWGIKYILPPLVTGQAEQLWPALKAAGDILKNRTEQGFDPAYNNGKKVWIDALVESIWITDGSYDSFSVPDGMQFYLGWTGTMRVLEREMPNTDWAKLTGIEGITDEDPATGAPVVPDVADFRTDVPDVGPSTR